MRIKLPLLILAVLWTLSEKAQAPTLFNSRGIGGGGALFSPSINPFNHSEIYIGCDMSDLFHSTDQGQDWTCESFTQVQGGHDSYVSFSDTTIRYSVSYPSPGGNDEILPLKSTDAGQTWNVLTGNPYPTSPNGDILRLIADYNNPNHIVIADYGTIYFSQDGGNTFNQIHTCLNNGSGNHIAGVFFDSNNIYIGTNDGLLYSTNGGTTFDSLSSAGIPSDESMLSFAGGRENGKVRFACLTSTSVYAGITYGDNYWGEMAGVYTMDDTSGVWTSKLGGITINSDYPVFVGMASNDIDTMYLAGGSSISAPIVMRTDSLGDTWHEVFLTSNNQNIFTGWAGDGGNQGWDFPEAPFGFDVCKNDSRILMFGDYSCAHITTDAGNNWKQQYLNTADENAENALTPKGRNYHGIGLENTSCWDIMWVDSLHMLSGFSDITGVISADKGSSWKFVPNIPDNSIYRIVQSTNGNIYACTSSRHDIYQTTTIYDNTLNGATGNVYVSYNTGASFNLLKSFGGSVIWVALDPTDTNRLYAAVINSDTAVGGIWKTNNLSSGALATWIKCNNPPRTEGHSFNINVLKDGSLVVSFSAHKPTEGSSFTQSSGVFYSNNGGQTWADRSDPGMTYWTMDVIIDTNDTTNSTWYAGVYSGWGNDPQGNGGLYKTTNKGVSWTQINTEYRVSSCTINPADANEMYFSTETGGLWYSNNINDATPTFTLVQAYPFRHPMRVFFNPWNISEMWVSSFGYGMAMANTSCSLAPPVVTQNDRVLSSTTASTYQWLLNGDSISGATSQNYTATQTGTYSVQVSNGSGCTATSQGITVTLTGINTLTGNTEFLIYPNPAHNLLHISIQNPDNGNASISLYDMLGQKLQDESMANKTEIDLDISGLASGVYLVKARNQVAMFVKQ